MVRSGTRSILLISATRWEDWYAWQDSNLRPVAPEQTDLFPSFTSFPMVYIDLHQFRASAFAQKVEPLFLQLHRLQKEFWNTFGTPKGRYREKYRQVESEIHRCRRSVPSPASGDGTIHWPHQVQAQAAPGHQPHPRRARKRKAGTRLQRSPLRSLWDSTSPSMSASWASIVRATCSR